MTSAIQLVMCATLFLLLSACAHKEIFQTPPKGASNPPPSAPSESTVTLAARIPYSVIKQAIISKASAPLTFSGSDPMACAQIPYVIGPQAGTRRECAQVPYLDFRGGGTQEQCINVPTLTAPRIGTNSQCANFNWHGTVSREGDAVLARSGDALHIELPLRIDGQGGVSGDLARFLSLSAKNFEVHARPAINLNLNMSDQWCPIVSATPTGEWVNSAKVEVVGRNCIGIDLGPLGHPQICAGPANIDLSERANKEVASHQSIITTAAQNALSCDAVKGAVASRWKTISIPLAQVPNQSIFLNIVPTGAAVSGLIAEDNAIKLVVQMKAQTQVATAAIPITAVPLPKLGKIDSATSSLALHVQTTAPYDALTQLLSDNLKGKDFSQDTKAGKVTVHVDDVTIYPSQSSLAVGVKVSAKTPGKVLDTTGWVYLVGQPTVGKSGNSIEIQNLKYAAVLDNAFWEIIADIFNTQILANLRAHSTIELGKLISDTANQVSRSVNSAVIPGVKISATTPIIKLESVAIGKEGFIVTTKMDMNFDMEITSALLGL